MVIYLNQSRSLPQSKLECDLVIYLVLWMAMFLFQIAILEVDASLKWVSWQSKLKSDTYITEKEKTQLSGLTLKVVSYIEFWCEVKENEVWEILINLLV